MEVIFKRFPLVRLKVLKNLDNQSLAISIQGIRGFAELLKNERFYWIRILKKNMRSFEGAEDSWREVLYRVPVDFVRQLVFASQNPLNYYRRRTPFHFAARDGHLDICQLIMERVANKSPTDNTGWTPLHFAAMNGHLDICQLIIERVENKNPASNSGWTPLHIAAMYGYLNICKLIMDNVMDKYPRNNSGKTPKNLADQMHRVEISKLFES